MKRYVKMKPLKELIRKRLIDVIHVSDDGEFMRYKILPDGPEVGTWMCPGEKLLVVDCPVIHENLLKMAPHLYEEVGEDDDN